MIVGYIIRDGIKCELHSTKGWRASKTSDAPTDGFVWERPVHRGLILKRMTPAAIKKAVARHVHPRRLRHANLG